MRPRYLTILDSKNKLRRAVRRYAIDKNNAVPVTTINPGTKTIGNRVRPKMISVTEADTLRRVCRR